jgi:hypothetical protein
MAEYRLNHYGRYVSPTGFRSERRSDSHALSALMNARVI